jgi:hypothetical protein
MSSEVDLVISSWSANAFKDTKTKLPTIDSVVSVDVFDSDSQPIALDNLEDPFIIEFKIDPKPLLPGNMWPECVFWDQADSSWDTKGCSLYNVDQINTWLNARSRTEDVLSLQCACFHLTTFSVGFTERTTVAATFRMSS